MGGRITGGLDFDPWIRAGLLKSPVSTVAIRFVQFKANRNAFSYLFMTSTINYNQLQFLFVRAVSPQGLHLFRHGASLEPLVAVDGRGPFFVFL